jgi:ribonuclease VapC
MIVIDTSAVIAVLTEEPEAEAFRRVLALSDDSRISAATLVEVAQVASRWGNAMAEAALDEFLATMQIAIEPFSDAHFRVAREAFLKFGKGRGHPAQLNQMDCISYALAKTLNAPLLFKGNDFPKTDIAAAA